MYRETPPSSMPLKTLTSWFSITASVPFFPSQTSFSSTGPTGLSSPLYRATLSSGAHKREQETSDRTTECPLGMIFFERDFISSRHFSKMNSKNVANRLIHVEFMISFIKFMNIYFFTMTNLSASNGVSMMFQDYFEERNSIFFFPNFHSVICLSFVNFSYTADYLTLAFLMLPREVRSVCRLTTRAE